MPYTQHLTIPCEFPSFNEVIAKSKQHFSQYATLKKEYTLLVSWYARRQLKPVDSRVAIHFDWYCKHRRRDPDNVASAKKFVIDGLVNAGILPDDSWRYIAGFTDRFFIDRDNPRVEVTIEEV